jgi:ubiquinone/menaquinone biosynthesis C-methylase UbiE
MLGPLYHLQAEVDRIQAVSELFRVTKKGGIVFVAFQSRIKMTINSLQYPQAWKPNDTIDGINKFYEMGIFNHPY